MRFALWKNKLHPDCIYTVSLFFAVLIVIFSRSVRSFLLCSFPHPPLSSSPLCFLVTQSIGGLCGRLYCCLQGHIFTGNSVCVYLLYVFVLYVRIACIIECMCWNWVSRPLLQLPLCSFPFSAGTHCSPGYTISQVLHLPRVVGKGQAYVVMLRQWGAIFPVDLFLTHILMYRPLKTWWEWQNKKK